MEGSGDSKYDGYYGLGYERNVGHPTDVDILAPINGWGPTYIPPVRIFYKLKKDTFVLNDGRPIVQFLQQTYPVVAIYTFKYSNRAIFEWHMHDEDSKCLLWSQTNYNSNRPSASLYGWNPGDNGNYFPDCHYDEHLTTPHTVYL